MRPARKGPENVVGVAGVVSELVASMRPARKGPENAELLRHSPTQYVAASMRPARKGPENLVEDVAGDYALDGLQ